MAAVLLVVSAFVLGIARLGSDAIASARADSIADVVALGSVSGGLSAGKRVAEANGARLVEVVQRADRSVLVEIEFGSFSAFAAATTEIGE